MWQRQLVNLDEERITAHALELLRKADHLLPRRGPRDAKAAGRRRR
jgi:hypothetical protein